MGSLNKITNEIDRGIEALEPTIQWMLGEVYRIPHIFRIQREIVHHTKSFTIEIKLHTQGVVVSEDIHIRADNAPPTDIIRTTVQRYLETITQLADTLSARLGAR